MFWIAFHDLLALFAIIRLHYIQKEAVILYFWGSLISSILKKRLLYAILIIIVIALGLASRSFTEVLPLFVLDHFGDALWAAMVYFGFRFLLDRKNLFMSALAALGFCWIIEFSQLYQAAWINEIRSNVFGALVLGQGFLWLDLLRYSIGVGIVALADLLIVKQITAQR